MIREAQMALFQCYILYTHRLSAWIYCLAAWKKCTPLLHSFIVLPCYTAIIKYEFRFDGAFAGENPTAIRGIPR